MDGQAPGSESRAKVLYKWPGKHSTIVCAEMNPKVHGPRRTKGADSFHGNGFPARQARPEWPTVEHNALQNMLLIQTGGFVHANAENVVGE
jgi:hypothetical protein